VIVIFNVLIRYQLHSPQPAWP